MVFYGFSDEVALLQSHKRGLFSLLDSTPFVFQLGPTELAYYCARQLVLLVGLFGISTFKFWVYVFVMLFLYWFNIMFSLKYIGTLSQARWVSSWTAPEIIRNIQNTYVCTPMSIIIKGKKQGRSKFDCKFAIRTLPHICCPYFRSLTTSWQCKYVYMCVLSSIHEQRTKGLLDLANRVYG